MGSGFLEDEGWAAAELLVFAGRTHRIRLLNGECNGILHCSSFLQLCLVFNHP